METEKSPKKKWWRRYLKITVLGALIVAAVFLSWTAAKERRAGIMTVSFLDVGQGDATLVDSPAGNRVLIDGGPGRIILSRLAAAMPFYDRRIALLIETHPDSDHAAGLADVLENYSVGALLVSGVKPASRAEDLIEIIAREKGVKIIQARRGQLIDLGEGAKIRVLFPDRALPEADTNAASIVTLLEYGQTRFLSMADSPTAIDEYLADLEKENLRAEVIKVGHHGSKTSTSAALLGYAGAKYAIISAGKDNRYGHPDKEVLDKLADFDLIALRTDELGAITFTSDGETMLIEN